MTITLFNFNNYFNRIAKYHKTLDRYIEEGDLLLQVSGVNFVPNDGITTKQIVNYSGSGTPDYLIVSSEITGDIESRWFVIDATRTSLGQFNLSLMRDVIADYRQEVFNSTVFIEKANLTSDNPLIFNKENMSFNQIKQKEVLLKDASGIPWIVGYVDKDFTKTVSIPALIGGEGSIAGVYSSFESYPYYQYTEDNPFKILVGTDDAIRFRLNGYVAAKSNEFPEAKQGQSMCFAWNARGEDAAPIYNDPTTGRYFSYYVYEKPSGAKNIGYAFTMKSEMEYRTVSNVIILPTVKKHDWTQYTPSSYFSDLKTQIDLNALYRERGKIYQIGDKYYEIDIVANKTGTSLTTVSPNSALGLFMEEIAGHMKTSNYINDEDPAYSPLYEMEVLHWNYYPVFNEVNIDTLNLEIKTNRLHSQFLPYDIFCIPYGEIYTSAADKTIRDYGIKLANEIIRVAGTSLYDIQLLPYCPLQDRLTTFSGKPGISVKTANGDDTAVDESGSLITGLFWVDNPNFEVNIDYTIEMPESNIEIKVANECDMYRLVSPNYNGQFEFSPVKNNGVNRFMVDCSYKPFTPYIKVSPQFAGLYGYDFDDARGLICSGDFSLTQSSDPWVQYQIQNKNYQEMFDREIKYIDRANDIQQQKDMIGAAMGTLSAATTGAIAGSSIGGGVGAAIGGVGAGLIAGALGAQDVYYNMEMREEQRALKMDQFGYQLGNIQALPTNLTKVSSFNKNNKLFPFLEYYTCTEVEKQALRDKIKYNGMTVMTIGSLEDYLFNDDYYYIKGKLIRMENVPDDYHVVDVIGEELSKGVYI